jgi:hypothetical protein
MCVKFKFNELDFKRLNKQEILNTLSILSFFVKGAHPD